MNLNELPNSGNFKAYDLVYSKSRGLGRVIHIHNNQPVVAFSEGRLRIDLNEEKLAIVPDELHLPPKRPTLYVDGEKESRASLTMQRKWNFISIFQLADVLGMTPKKLISRLEEMGYKVYLFGRRKMVARQDIPQIEKSI